MDRPAPRHDLGRSSEVRSYVINQAGSLNLHKKTSVKPDRTGDTGGFRMTWKEHAERAPLRTAGPASAR
jgi:hypothetical protein